MGERVAVASSVFNMAGPESKRPDFLKSLIISGIVRNVPSMGDLIAGGYRNGPAIRFKSFSRWAKQSEEFQKRLGNSKGTLQVPKTINMRDLKSVLMTVVPVPPNGEIHIERAEIDSGDILYWAQQYLAQHQPARLHENWGCEYDGETETVTITFPDQSTLSFPPGSPLYSPDSTYLYVSYTPIQGEEKEPIEEGDITEPPEDEDFPATVGWRTIVDNDTPKTQTIKSTLTTEITYSDGRPGSAWTFTAPRNVNYYEIERRYQRDEYLGDSDPSRDSIATLRHFQEHRQTSWIETKNSSSQTEEDVGGGVTKTTTVTQTEEIFHLRRTVQFSTQKIFHKTWLPQETFIYRRGDGIPSLDAFFGTEQAEGIFYPPIPMRFGKNTFRPPVAWDLTHTKEGVSFGPPPTSIWVTSEARMNAELPPIEALLRAISRDNLVLRVEEIQGQKGPLAGLLKTKSPLYLLVQDDGSSQEWVQFTAEPTLEREAAYDICKKAFRKAYGADYAKTLKSIDESEGIEDVDYAYALFGVSLNVQEHACRKYVYKFLQHLMRLSPMSPAEHTEWVLTWQAAQASEIRWRAWKQAQKHVVDPFNFNNPEPPRTPYPSRKLRELDVHSVHHTQSNFRNKFLWRYIFEEQGQGKLKEGAKKGELWFDVDPSVSGDNNKFTLSWQETGTSWRRLTVYGFQHRNYIYRDNYVQIYANDALKDQEESGFIIPLQEDVYHSMSMVDRTQMATACCFLVFNCYAVKKTSFWESWGAIFLIALVVVAAVIVAVATGGAGIGLLGSAEAVGTAIGVSGTAGIIVGAAVNALAGILVSYFLIESSAAVFGEKWGRAVGIVVSALFIMGVMAGVNSVDIVDAFLSPEGVTEVSSAVLEGGSTVLEITAQEVAQATQAMLEENNKELKRIQKLIEEEFGTGRKIDPKNVSQYLSELFESPDQFLSRTLMTGSDIVEMQLGLLSNFVEVTLSTKLP